MAELESNLRAHLIAQGGITAIFGSSNTRIYVDRMDPKITVAYPFAIIRTVAEAPSYAHDGALPDTGIYQIDVYSDSKTTVNSGTTAIRTELSGFTGSLSSITVGASLIVNTRGGFDPDKRVFRRSTDVLIAQNG